MFACSYIYEFICIYLYNCIFMYIHTHTYIFLYRHKEVVIKDLCQLSKTPERICQAFAASLPRSFCHIL